jgi:hypothetical protein
MNFKHRLLFSVIFFALGTRTTSSQGTVQFWTLDRPYSINALVTFAQTGERLGNGFFAQLYIGPAGSPVIQLKPQGPILAFSDGPGAGYIYPGEQVKIQGFDTGVGVTVDVRAFNGVSWEESSIRGESNPLQITLGGIDGSPLFGLQPFTVDNVPEPNAVVLFASGAAALILSAWRRRRER